MRSLASSAVSLSFAFAIPARRALKSSGSHSWGGSLVPVFWDSLGAVFLPFLWRAGVVVRVRRERVGRMAVVEGVGALGLWES